MQKYWEKKFWTHEGPRRKRKKIGTHEGPKEKKFEHMKVQVYKKWWAHEGSTKKERERERW